MSMTATKRRIALDIVATDTHCGEECPASGVDFDACLFWFESREWNSGIRKHVRLPECIAAEKAQKASEQP